MGSRVRDMPEELLDDELEVLGSTDLVLLPPQAETTMVVNRKIAPRCRVLQGLVLSIYHSV
jgi:hypothetical protein